MSSVIVKHVGTAWVSVRPLQPSVASQYKSTPIPRRRLAVREREQGRLPRIAACGVTVEVALRHTCHAGGGSRGVDEKLDRRVGLRARLVSTALHRRRPFGEVLGWRAG